MILDPSGSPVAVKPLKPISHTISLYAYGDMRADVFDCHMALTSLIHRHKIIVTHCTIREDALISRSRCRQAAEFLKHGTDVWVQIDHDVGFKPQDVLLMAKLALDHDAIVCVPYAKRSWPPSHACRSVEPLPPPGTNELVEIQFGASGFMAIPRAALLKITSFCESPECPSEFRISECNDVKGSTFKTWFQPFVLNKEYLSEDYAFCARAAIAGVTVFAWCAPQLFHYGIHGYSLPMGHSSLNLDRDVKPVS